MVQHEALGPLEMRVLGLLEGGEPLAVATIRERLEREGSDLAYTTVMTVLTRLYEKGFVTRERDGNRYLYAPAAHAPRVLSGILSRVQRALSATGRDKPLLALLEQEDFSDAELRELRRAIDRKIGAKKR